MTPNPVNRNIAAAAAILSIQPGNGSDILVFIIAGLIRHIGREPRRFFKILSQRDFVKVYVLGNIPKIYFVSRTNSLTGIYNSYFNSSYGSPAKLLETIYLYRKFIHGLNHFGHN